MNSSGLPAFFIAFVEGLGLAVRNVVVARAMHQQHRHSDLGRAMHRRYRPQVDFRLTAHAVAPVAVPGRQHLVAVMAHHVVEIGDSRPADRAPVQLWRPDCPHQCRVPAIRGAHDADALRVDGALVRPATSRHRSGRPACLRPTGRNPWRGNPYRTPPSRGSSAAARRSRDSRGIAPSSRYCQLSRACGPPCGNNTSGSFFGLAANRHRQVGRNLQAVPRRVRHVLHRRERHVLQRLVRRRQARQLAHRAVVEIVVAWIICRARPDDKTLAIHAS